MKKINRKKYKINEMKIDYIKNNKRWWKQRFQPKRRI